MGCIAVLLLLCLPFTAGVENGDDQCSNQYFYNGIPPLYYTKTEDNISNPEDVFICQRWQETPYFVTRYSTRLKIPIYSAYVIKQFVEKNELKKSAWRLTNFTILRQNLQASHADYLGSGYDRGHLNPRFHNLYSKNSIRATFILTNAVPKKHSVNNKWYNFAERPVFQLLKNHCRDDAAVQTRRFIITGIVPGNVTSKMRSVNIPELVWTAALCVQFSSSQNQNWSVGYWLNTSNIEDRGSLVTINALQDKLKNLLREQTNGRDVILFHNNVHNWNSGLKPATKRPRPPDSCSNDPDIGGGLRPTQQIVKPHK